MKKRALINSLGLALGLVMAAASQAAPVTLVNAIGVNKEVANKGSITDTRTATNANNKVIKDGLVVSIAAGTDFLGDYTFTLSHGGKSVKLFTPNGDASNLWNARPVSFSDSYSRAASKMGSGWDCGTYDIVGYTEGCKNSTFIPVESLSVFNGMTAGGNWELKIEDAGNNNTSGQNGRHGFNGPRDLTLSKWTLAANLMDAPLTPAQVPEPASLALVGLALGGAMLARRRSKKA